MILISAKREESWEEAAAVCWVKQIGSCKEECAAPSFEVGGVLGEGEGEGEGEEEKSESQVSRVRMDDLVLCYFGLAGVGGI